MKSATAHRYRVVDVFTENPLEGNPLRARNKNGAAQHSAHTD